MATNPILSAQRNPYGRDVDFIYTNFRGRPHGNWDFLHLPNVSALRALGDDVKKMSISKEMKYVHMVSIFSALRTLGGEVKLFKQNLC